MPLPKSLIKKYGVSKKAWRIYKARKGTTRRTTRKVSRKRKALNTRKIYRRPMAKRKGTRSKKSKNFGFGITEKDIYLAAGIGLAGAGGSLVNKVTKGKFAGNIAQGGAGLAVMHFTKGKQKNIGKGMVLKTLGDIIEDQVAPKIMDLVSGFGETNTNTNTATNGGANFS